MSQAHYEVSRKKKLIAVSRYEDTEDGYQIDGLTLATIVVLEFPPRESWQDMIMSQRKKIDTMRGLGGTHEP